MLEFVVFMKMLPNVRHPHTGHHDMISGRLSIDDARDGIKRMMIDGHNVSYTCTVAYYGTAIKLSLSSFVLQ